MATAILAVGLVLFVEGLVFALAPTRLEDLLETLTRISPEGRRMIGLGAIALGVLLVATARGMGA